MYRSKPATASRGGQVANYLLSDIRLDLFVEIELLLLTFTTGIQDATTFPDFHCFASNQTGNTVILAIAVAGLSSPLFSTSNIGVSLGTFLAGGWTMGQIGNIVGTKRRIWLLISNTIQTAMIFAASALQMRYGVHGDGPLALAAIALLAFSSGAQVAMARATQMNEITTAMATAAWVDLIVDPEFVGRHNRPRNRRALFLLSLVGGSFAGAFAYARIGSAFALLVSAIGKLVVTISFLFNRGEAGAPEQARTCDQESMDHGQIFPVRYS